ncbi:hypothetical protein JW960_10860 [candidate division KSB1 bacterium]|nr:hypothetical protein [candidate division KSB1 bacterium]
MKTRFLFIILMLAIVSTGCEKRSFTFVLDIKQTQIYNIDQIGPFEIGRVVSREDVLAAADIPKDARIKDVKIQSVAINTKVLEGNQASKLVATATINDLLTGKERVFEDYSVPLTGLLGISNPFSPVSLLLDGGIDALKDKIQGYVKNDDFYDYELILEGNTEPANQRLVAEVKLKIVATVKYEECLDVLGFTSDGEPCSDVTDETM